MQNGYGPAADEGDDTLEFRILGPLEVEGAAGHVPLGGRKQRALLALLLLRANQVVPADRLIDLLWTDDPPADAAKALQVHVSRLRRVLESEHVLQTRPGGYLLTVEPGRFDLARFEELASRGAQLLASGDPHAAREALSEALGLWRGPPLPELGRELFAQGEVARLDELHLVALENRIEADLLLGDHGAVVGELETLVRREPLRERLREQLMLALYRCGRQAEALEAYRTARKALVDELGIEPGKRLQELEQAILRQDAALEPPAQVAREAPRPGRRAAGIFVGREQELQELTAGLDDALAGRGRLFLVSGESGVGKTRLADELASRAKDLGLRVLWGRSWKDGDAPELWPWRQAMRSLGDLPESADRFGRFNQVVQLLRQSEEPVLLVLDDVHAADDASLELLGDVAGELAELPVLLVATYAEAVELPPPVAALAHHAAHHRLALRPLDVGEVAEFVRLVGAGDDPAALHTETGGNPRLVWQRVR